LAKHAGISKDAVIRAAQKIADAKGWDALTLAGVAGKLRIRSPSLYNHVGGLEDLRRELKLLGLRELGAALGRATIGKSRDDAVRGLAAAYRNFVKEHPSWSFIQCTDGVGLALASGADTASVAPSMSAAAKMPTPIRLLSIIGKTLISLVSHASPLLRARALRKFVDFTGDDKTLL
jgi:AcrR family transcriptional regulator